MGKYFGTDGFRGEANVKLTADHARQRSQGEDRDRQGYKKKQLHV